MRFPFIEDWAAEKEDVSHMQLIAEAAGMMQEKPCCSNPAYYWNVFLIGCLSARHSPCKLD